MGNRLTVFPYFGDKMAIDTGGGGYAGRNLSK